MPNDKVNGRGTPEVSEYFYVERFHFLPILFSTFRRKAELSKARGTNLSLPNLSIPNLSLPDLSLPDLSLPNQSLPDLTLPTEN